MKELFTPEMHLSDVIDINYGILQVISRTGLDLTYSGLRVSEACQKSGIDPDTFVLIANVYSFPGFVPSSQDLEHASVPGILRYLRSSHEYYTGQALLSLGKVMDSLLEPCNEKQKQVVIKFYDDYRTELLKHFSYEENVVFPYVEALLSGQSGKEYNIEKFEEHHENVEEKLDDMKNIVMKYLPAECENEKKMMVLLSIYHLHDDLQRHTYVENNILVPVVGRLERNGR